LRLYKAVLRGHRLYKNLLAEYNPRKRDYVLFFPEKDRAFNYQGLLYLDGFYSYLEYIRKSLSPISVFYPPPGNFFVVASEKSAAESAKYFSKRIKGSKVWDPEDMEDFISYYCVYRPGNVIIVSLEKPNGRSCARLAGVGGIDLKTLILMGVYGASHDFSRDLDTPPPPAYDGGNPLVSGFINAA
jgi:hypothetical protein